MADIITHVCFAREIKDKINCNNSIISYSLGPDVFYFNFRYKKYGKVIHRKCVYDFFKNYIMYIKNNNLMNNDLIMGSLYGFISHYVLDRNIHNYISNNRLHRKYEMSISKIILEKSNYNNKIYNLILINKSKIIKELLNSVFYDTFNYKNCGNIYLKSQKKVKRIYKFFRYDRYGLKKKLYKILDKIFNKNISDSSFYNIENIVDNNNVINIYNDSMDECILFINTINEIIYKDIDINILNDLINNRNYVRG